MEKKKKEISLLSGIQWGVLDNKMEIDCCMIFPVQSSPVIHSVIQQNFFDFLGVNHYINSTGYKNYKTLF